MTHIHFVNNASDTTLASTRMRIKTPIKLLTKAGYKITESDTVNSKADVVIFHKHHAPVYEQQMIQILNNLGVKTVFDVSDFHMESPKLKDHYQFMVNNASVITVNGPTLLNEIKKYTTKPLFLVKDPITFPEYKPPSVESLRNPRLMWFGHATNVKPLMMVLEEIQQYPLTVITNVQLESSKDNVKTLMWKEGLVETEIYNHEIVILPLKDEPNKQFKNTNRAVDSLMAGRFVITDSLNYKELEPFVFIGPIPHGIEFVKSNPEKARQMILDGQEYVREVYSDKRMLNSLEDAFGLKQQNQKTA